jgi:molybdopterin-guanine dinucleotide biosynthesis protein A
VAKQRVRIAVLAGGLGSRLGGAKASAALVGRPLIAHVVEAARATGLPVVVLAKRDTPLPPLEAELVLEPDQPRHPLTGLVAALRALPDDEEAIVATGCDTPFVGARLLLALASRQGAAAPRCGGTLQPLPARYPRSALGALEDALAARRPLTAALAALRPEVVEEAELATLGDPDRLLFNVNDAAGLSEAERLALSDRP